MSQSKKFQRKIENFVCANCSFKVVGNGYTDHCPNCLVSLHVDNNPGDRLSGCKGIMEPIGSQVKGNSYIIFYKCKKCGKNFKVKSSLNDNFEMILKLSNQPIHF